MSQTSGTNGPEEISQLVLVHFYENTDSVRTEAAAVRGGGEGRVVGLIIATFVRQHLFAQHSSREDELKTALRVPSQTRLSQKVIAGASGVYPNVLCRSQVHFSSAVLDQGWFPPGLTVTTEN